MSCFGPAMPPLAMAEALACALATVVLVTEAMWTCQRVTLRTGLQVVFFHLLRVRAGQSGARFRLRAAAVVPALVATLNLLQVAMGLLVLQLGAMW